MRLLLASTLLLTMLVGCPSRVDDGPPPDPADAGADAGASPADAGADGGLVLQVTWRPCPLKTGLAGTNAECAVLAPPLEASTPNGPRIEYFVKRYRPPGGRGLKALWMLQGGPGASGLVFEGLSEQLATRFPDVDYYFPDHRGTGRSSRIDCPLQEAPQSEGGLSITAAEWPACLAAVQERLGPQLAAYNVTNAANDVGLAIAATRKPGQPVFIYGVSYGTFLAHRYLQLFPDQVDGVVLDSIAPPGISLYRQDADAHEAARDYFAACSADPTCGAKLPMAWQTAEALFAKLKMGHCPDIAVPVLPTHVLLRRAFGSFLMDPGLRGYIAPIVYRANRCEPKDVEALKVLMAQISAEPASLPLELQLWGWLLTHNILHSEFGETPTPTAAQLQALREGAVASRDVTEGFEATLSIWPRYAPDRFVGGWADTPMPLLMLNGGLDPATILRKAREFRPRFSRPNQTWVEFPTASHTTISSSPFVDERGERRSCGTRLMMAFMDAPRGSLDTGCVAKVEGINFAFPNAGLTQALFGTTNAWE